LFDAKSGLAAVLQVRGENLRNSKVLRRSIARHREIVGMSRGAGHSLEEAGPLENLANCVLALSRIVDPDEAERLKTEAKFFLRRATSIFERLGKSEQAQLARAALERVDLLPDPKASKETT
jgi:hypothetical protein